MTFDELASMYQSRRVAQDWLDGRRPDLNSEHWWWWNPVLDLDRLELERAKQARQQSDRDPFVVTP